MSAPNWMNWRVDGINRWMRCIIWIYMDLPAVIWYVCTCIVLRHTCHGSWEVLITGFVGPVLPCFFLRGKIPCADLICNHPDDTSRRLVQYGYRTSWLGFLIIHCWTATLVVTYMLTVWGCWMSYTIFGDLYFPPGSAFWQEIFKSWDGVMFPWCASFVLSHVCLVGVLIFWDAMRSQSMLPATSMAQATHLMVQETLEDGVEDGTAGRGSEPVSPFRICSLLADYMQRLRQRQILRIQKCNGNLYVQHMCVRALEGPRQFPFWMALNRASAGMTWLFGLPGNYHFHSLDQKFNKSIGRTHTHWDTTHLLYSNRSGVINPPRIHL